LSISPSNISAVSGSPQEAGTVFVQVQPLHGQNNSDFQQLAPFMQHPAHNQTVAAPYPNYPIVQVGQTMQPSVRDQSRQTTAPSIDVEVRIATAQPGGINLLRQDSSGGRTTLFNGGRTTPSSSGRATPSIDDGVGKAVKSGREGREKGALSYSAAEHLFPGKLGSGRSSVTLQSNLWSYIVLLRIVFVVSLC